LSRCNIGEQQNFAVQWRWCWWKFEIAKYLPGGWINHKDLIIRADINSQGGKFMAQFEVRYFDKDNWEEVSENTILEVIQESFIRATPAINEMLKGKMLLASNGIYRMKKEITA
jgi:hypothetical protein